MLLIFNALFIQLKLPFLFSLNKNNNHIRRCNQLTGWMLILLALISIPLITSIVLFCTSGSISEGIVWPLFGILLIWDLWYLACDILYFDDINETGLNVRSTRLYVLGFVLGFLAIIIALPGVYFVYQDVHFKSAQFSMVLCGEIGGIIIAFITYLFSKYELAHLYVYNGNFQIGSSHSCLHLSNSTLDLLCCNLLRRMNVNVDHMQNRCVCITRCFECCCINICDPICCDICFYKVLKKCWCFRQCANSSDGHMKRRLVLCMNIVLMVAVSVLFLQRIMFLYIVCRASMLVVDITADMANFDEIYLLRDKIYKCL